MKRSLDLYIYIFLAKVHNKTLFSIYEVSINCAYKKYLENEYTYIEYFMII